MSPREKRLAIIVCILAGVAALWRLGLPAVDEYVFAVAEENDGLRETLADLDEELAKIDQPRQKYREFVSRTGGTDVGKVKNDVQRRLTELIDRAGLSSPRLTPRSPTDYKPAGIRKKTGIRVIRFTLTADASLEAFVHFFEAFYELPYIAQLVDITLDPPSGRSRRRGGLVRLTASIDVLVPPRHRVARINESELTQPVKQVKLRGLAYAAIWERGPFEEYEPPPPPTWACCFGNGQCRALSESACDSRAGSFYEDQQCSDVADMEPCIAQIPCCIPEEGCMMMTSADCELFEGTPRIAKPSCAGVNCSEEEELPDEDPLAELIGDPDRETKFVRMALLYGYDEVMVVDTRDNSFEYVGLSDQLDEGAVLMVHPRAAITRREDGQEWLYPVGKSLADSMPLEDALNAFPEVVFEFQMAIDAGKIDGVAGEAESDEDLGPIEGPRLPEQGSDDAEPGSDPADAAETVKKVSDAAKDAAERRVQRRDQSKKPGDASAGSDTKARSDKGTQTAPRKPRRGRSDKALSPNTKGATAKDKDEVDSTKSGSSEKTKKTKTQ